VVSEVMRTGDFAVEEVSLARSAAVVGGGWVKSRGVTLPAEDLEIITASLARM